MTDFDKLTKGLENAQKALAELDGDLGTVNFDPNNPASIEAAIIKMEQMIDEKVGAYASNPFVGPMIEAAKENLRERILEQAAQARLEGGAE